MIVDPIVAEIHSIRQQLFARCHFHVDEMVREAREKQQKSGRRIIPVPVVERQPEHLPGEAQTVLSKT